MPRTWNCLVGFVRNSERKRTVVVVFRMEAHGGRKTRETVRFEGFRSPPLDFVSHDPWVGFVEEDERKTIVVVAHRFVARGGRKSFEE